MTTTSTMPTTAAPSPTITPKAAIQLKLELELDNTFSLALRAKDMFSLAGSDAQASLPRKAMVTQSRSKPTLPPHAPAPRPILTLPNTHLQGELKDHEWDDHGDVAAYKMLQAFVEGKYDTRPLGGFKFYMKECSQPILSAGEDKKGYYRLYLGRKEVFVVDMTLGDRTDKGFLARDNIPVNLSADKKAKNWREYESGSS
ncbi:hypothetical protein BU17DRAFT_61842 [Hysterangium stoloniferum]|nr:hypothetical protein BU17DRAFT_61842 [Hysterangium stoloniferum]